MRKTNCPWLKFRLRNQLMYNNNAYQMGELWGYSSVSLNFCFWAHMITLHWYSCNLFSCWVNKTYNYMIKEKKYFIHLNNISCRPKRTGFPATQYNSFVHKWYYPAWKSCSIIQNIIYIYIRSISSWLKQVTYSLSNISCRP